MFYRLLYDCVYQWQTDTHHMKWRRSRNKDLKFSKTGKVFLDLCVILYTYTSLQLFDFFEP